MLLFIFHSYPATVQDVSPSAVQTLENLSSLQSDFGVTLTYPLFASGIGSWKKKSRPTFALTLQSGMGSGSKATWEMESGSHGSFRCVSSLVKF